jgi:hypothetical protein
VKRSHKPLPKVEIISYGRYAGWAKEEKELPALVSLTDRIRAEADIEFGLIVEIRQGKGRFIQYCIEHPPFRDPNGLVLPSFTGEYQIRTNPARFFLGDAIQAPVEDKKGDWILKIMMEDSLLAEKRIKIF